MEVAKFHQQGPIWPVVLTGLTGGVQWTRGLVFRCVLGSWGWKLVPRFSSTLVATWTWPTWVVSRRRVLEVVFVLLEHSSPSRRIFIGSHLLPPSLVRRIGPSVPRVGRFVVTMWPWQVRVGTLACDFKTQSSSSLRRRIFISSYSLPLSGRLIDPSTMLRKGIYLIHVPTQNQLQIFSPTSPLIKQNSLFCWENLLCVWSFELVVGAPL
jgi:hypothetical protein